MSNFSSRTLKSLKNALKNTAAANEINELTGGSQQVTQVRCMTNVDSEIREITKIVCVDVAGVNKEKSQLVCVADASKKERSQILDRDKEFI